MDQNQFREIEKAIDLAISRVLSKGTDDVFKPPTFSKSIESLVISQNPDDFRKVSKNRAIRFLKSADLTRERIGPTRRGLVTKDHNSFRQCAWLDPFDAVNYLSTAYLLFSQIEKARIPKEEFIVHSHRMSQNPEEIFDEKFGYDSFRARSSELSRERIGKWKIVTDISNFFDRISNHSLENHLLNVGCDKKYTTLIREMLLFWAGDRRSFGIPVGSDASRILSEAVLLNVDSRLKSLNIPFVRYVDDFRIFADTRAEALKAIEILTNLLADEGLSLNSKKTEIFQIVEPEEIAIITNRFTGNEHEQIDLDEKIEVKRAITISGRSAVSRFYKEPGKEALKNIQKIDKESLKKSIDTAPNDEIEQIIKLAMKYFIYVDQDECIIIKLIERRITSIYYICDALIKESDKFSEEKCKTIKETLFNVIDWPKCAYPLQVPILRVSGEPAFLEPRFIHQIIDSHRHSDNMLFYREAISLGAACLDRARLRRLSIDVFPESPDFVRRAIFFTVKNHANLSEDEARPLLKNMQQHGEDWFIQNI